MAQNQYQQDIAYPDMNASKPLTATEFGESEYGQRLQYQKPVYQDIFFAILYYAHLGIVIVAAFYMWIVKYPGAKDEHIPSDEDWQSHTPMTGVIFGVIACLAVGIFFGLFWLQMMKRYAMIIIKAMLFLNIGVWVIVALVGLFTGAMIMAIIGVVLAAIYALYTFCIWSRIPFASALLSVSSAITSKYHGTIFLSLCVIVFNVVWIFIWGACSTGYYAVTDEPSQFVVFLLFVSLYWAFQVHQNISHTTTCGVAATWYYATEINYNPVKPAFKRTMTTSFGSICFGSLIVAILEAMKAMIRAAQNDSNECVTCVLLCLLNCIQSLVEWFNKYAYAQCAIYGTSFLTSAKATWGLLSSCGIDALINDDLSLLAIFGGSLISGVCSAGVGYFIGFVFYRGSQYDEVSTGMPIALAIYGFLIGLILCHTVLYVVHSAIICLFVCYAEDPAALQQNRPEEYNRISETRPEFATAANPL